MLRMKKHESVGEPAMDGQQLISGTVVQMRLAQGDWITGIIIAHSDQDQPSFRMLLDGGTASSPVTVEFPLPANAVVRLIPQGS